MQTLCKKLQAAKEGLSNITDPLRSDAALLSEIRDRLDSCMATYRAFVDAKLQSTLDESHASSLMASAMDHGVTAAGALQSAQLRLKQLKKRKS